MQKSYEILTTKCGNQHLQMSLRLWREGHPIKEINKTKNNTFCAVNYGK